MNNKIVEQLAGDYKTKSIVRSMQGIVENNADAYDIQEALQPVFSPFCGRKIALNTAQQVAAPGNEMPIFGFITGAGAMSPGVTLAISDFSELALEPEFAAVISKDIPPFTHVDDTTVLDYLNRFSLAFEVLDKRHAPAELHTPTFIVNNVFNAGIVLSTTALDISKVSTGAYQAVFRAAGAEIVNGHSTAPQNPVQALVAVVNHFCGRGHTIQAGEAILCGAHHPPMVITEPGEYVFSLSSAEAVNLSISD